MNAPKFLRPFAFHVDRFNCAMVALNAPELKTLSVEDFKSTLTSTITACEGQKIKCIFVHLATENSRLIDTTVQLGFSFHHVTSDDKLCLLRELQKANIPRYATHQVGGGALVLSPDLRRVLLVKEKSGNIGHMWKPPTGKVETGETIEQGVRRELAEETGVSADFLGLVAFRERFPATYGITDLYFVALLVAKGEATTPDPEEIADAGWFTLREFADFNYTEQIHLSYRRIARKLEQCGSLEEVKRLTFQMDTLDYSKQNQTGVMYTARGFFE